MNIEVYILVFIISYAVAWVVFIGSLHIIKHIDMDRL